MPALKKEKKLLKEEDEAEIIFDAIIEEKVSSDKTSDDDSDNDNEDHISPNDILLRKTLFDRLYEGKIDFNVLFLGKVSSGKSTLVNALLGDYYSEAKIQKTTQSISFYLTNEKENCLDRQTIFDINKAATIDINSEELGLNIFRVSEQICFPTNSKNINIFDTVGIDDPDAGTDEMTNQWIISNAKLIDLFVIVLDINQAFLTKSDKKNIKKLIGKCNDNILFVINKFDEFDNPELNDLFTKCEENINEIMKKYPLKNFDVCKVSALHEYIIKLTDNGKTHNLTTKEKNLYSMAKNIGSGFDKFYDIVTKYINKPLQPKIPNFLDKNIINTETDLHKICSIMDKSNVETFTEEQQQSISKYIYNCFENLKYDSFFSNYPEFNKKFDILTTLKKMRINEKLRGVEFDINIITDLVTETIDPNEKNMILRQVFDSEVAKCKDVYEKFLNVAAKNKKAYGYINNKIHYSTIVSLGKLISALGRDDIKILTMNSYVEFIVCSNLLCNTIALNTDFSGCIDSRQIYKTLIYYLLVTTDKYSDIFAKYKSLIKLRNIDGIIGIGNENVGKLLIAQIDLNNIDKYFEYFDIIKALDTQM